MVVARSVFHLLYVSSAVTRCPDTDLEGLLRHARAKNEKLGITGLLLYCDGNFMQALEGSEAAVTGLYAQICADPRHTDIRTLITYENAERDFPDWAMAYRHAPHREPFEACINLLGQQKGIRARLASEGLLPRMMRTFLDNNDSSRRFGSAS